MSDLRLTQTVQKGGCAAKVAAGQLREILSQVRFPKAHTELLIDGGHFDDAAIYRVSDDIALVQTLDFFTPIVDSPKRFGEIAAANALSDVYAMGGRPRTAMAILAFPLATMEPSVIVEVMQGASDKIAEAGANLVGGHSIDDDTLKFGLSVTGYVHPKRIWSNTGARAGDRLILTKPLGTGTMTAALKRSEVLENDIADVLESMAMLNDVTSALDMADFAAIHAATDVTGFGLAGHSMQMAAASGVSFRFISSNWPCFDRAEEFLKKGFLTKAHRSNAAYVEAFADFGSLGEVGRLLAFDPQTSGGLLLSVEASQAEVLVAKLRARFPQSAVIGDVTVKGEKTLFF